MSENSDSESKRQFIRDIGSVIDDLAIPFSHIKRDLTAQEYAKLKVMWATDLEGKSAHEVRLAAMEYRRSGEKWFPTTGAIIKIISGFQSKAIAAPTVDEAYQLAKRYASDVISRRHATHEIIGGALVERQPMQVAESVKRTVDAMGAQRFVECTTEEEGTLFAQFRAAYERVEERRAEQLALHPAVSAHIQGIADVMRARLPAPKTAQVVAPAEKLDAMIDDMGDRARAHAESDYAARKAKWDENMKDMRGRVK